MLKRISDLATEGGPVYYRFKAALKEWRNVYLRRKNFGDINVIKFIEYFTEV